jgi:flagellin
MLSIQTNVSAITARDNLNNTSNALSTSMQRLSSGFRINSAADDAAGLAISEKMTAQIGGLNQASQNAQDGISMLQTAEGAMNEVQSMMQRMRDLSVQAASDTNSQPERADIDLELEQLRQEINNTSTRTQFNGQVLLDGSLTSQQAATPWDTGSSATGGELLAGAFLSGDTTGSSTVAGIDVSGSATGVGYDISADTGGGTVTLTEVDSTGATMGATQQLTLTAMTAGGTETLNFSDFGVKIDLASGAGMSAADIAASFTSGNAVDVQAGSGGAIIQTGANQGETTLVKFADTRLTGGDPAMVALNNALTAVKTSFNGTDAAQAQTDSGALTTALDNALDSISKSRAVLGAAQNRLQATIDTLGTTSENLSAANSRIVDVDVATESSNMAKDQVLEQAGVSVLAQANQLPQLALKLLS